ncbi:arginase family protein [Candidatus Woesearchaeota archaeon]|nr:arginase family protein [Candidatus Woesearchaeota archaeon]
MKIIGIPFASGSLGKNEGCEKAPELVVKRLRDISVNEDGNSISFDFLKVDVDKNNFDSTHKEIQRVSGDVYIGGDHSITYSSFSSLPGKNKGIIILDAHPDLEVGTKTPDHESYLRVLIEERKIPKENILLVGIRSVSKNELDFIKQNKIKCIYMKSIFENGIRETADDITELAINFSDIYLSIDIDVLDPAFAPGTGYCEPGGMNIRELLFLLQRIKKMRNLKRIDLVEINPDKDSNGITLSCGAKILSTFF